MVEALDGAGFQDRDAAAFLQSFEAGSLRLLKTMTDLPWIQLLEERAEGSRRSPPTPTASAPTSG